MRYRDRSWKHDARRQFAHKTFPRSLTQTDLSFQLRISFGFCHSSWVGVDSLRSVAGIWGGARVTLEGVAEVRVKIASGDGVIDADGAGADAIGSEMLSKPDFADGFS